MLESKKYLYRTAEDILKAVAFFCEYHHLIHGYIQNRIIKSSVDRGAFVKPQDLLPEEVLKLLGEGKDGHSYAYGLEAGDETLRTKIAKVENLRHEASYRLDNVAIMPGAWAGLEFTIQEILNLGRGKSDKNRIAVIGPTLYQMFHYPIQSLGMNIVGYDFVIPEIEHTPKSIEDIEDIFRTKPKAIIISNPNNPDGKYFPNRLLEQVIRRSEDEKIYVIIDEMQSFFASDGQELRYGSWIQSPNVIRLDSPSKRYAIAEYRVGWVIADPTLLGDRMNGIVGRMSGIMGNAPKGANTALIYLMDKEIEKLLGMPDMFSEKWQELRQTQSYVENELKSMQNVKSIFTHDACINLAVKMNYDGTDMMLAEQLMKEGTLIMPASGYGYRPEDAVMRITFAEREKRLEHALGTLRKVLN